jgi:hypothetical protein
LHSIGLKFTTDDANSAAEKGQLDVVKWFHTQGINCTKKCMTEVIREGRLTIIDFLCNTNNITNNIIRLRPKDTHIAIKYGNLEVIHYLSTLKKPIYCTTKCANLAAKNGHLHIIQYLRHCKNPTHCTPKGAQWATRHKHTYVVNDLRNHGIIRAYEMQ